jgi:D-inositol-3-phosphate glycosyltransferase
MGKPQLARLGVTAHRISVIACGVNVSAFRPDGPSIRRGATPRVLAAGRLVKRKGFDTIVQALPDVPGAELVIAGGPPAGRLRGDGEYRRLSRLAAEVGVAGRVSFRGRVGRPDMPALMRSADLVVSVPWYAPLGMVPLEAMACGVPVVASAVGGHTDTVQDGVTGALVPPRDPGALSQVVADLLSRPDLARYGAAAAGRVRARYSWERIAHETAAVYEQVRAAGPRSRTAQRTG